MYVMARLAVQSPVTDQDRGRADRFSGRHVVVRALSETGFEADCPCSYPTGALVRLRLPCAGVAVARVTDTRSGWVRADFVNPVGRSRLAMTMGASAEVRAGIAG
jgi:hypothetical protein